MSRERLLPQEPPNLASPPCRPLWQVAFHSAADALSWCVSTQQLLLGLPWPQQLLHGAPADCGVVLAAPGPPIKPSALLPTYKRLLQQPGLVADVLEGGGALPGLEAVEGCELGGPASLRSASGSSSGSGGWSEFSPRLAQLLWRSSSSTCGACAAPPRLPLRCALLGANETDMQRAWPADVSCQQCRARAAPWSL